MNTRQTRLTLLGLALGVLLALLIAPQTRWLVKSQILPPSLLVGHYDAQKRQFVESHPNDYQIQLAGQTDSQTQEQYAGSLVPRFPDSVSLRANILRYASSSIHANRDEDYLIQGQPVPTPDKAANLRLPTPAELAAFDADAAAGEHLDPDNAYFPWMRSVGYFAAHRDAEGLAAVARASEKHIWREYYDDEVEGHWRINDSIFGGREAIASGAVSASLMLPHFASLRQTARIVIYKAILEEQAAYPEAGLALRLEMARCGQLMATQSTSMIGGLVGVAITSISRSQPGGIPAITSDSNLSNDQRAHQRLDTYCVYVTKIGHPEDAAEARTQFQTWQQIHGIIGKDSDYIWGNRMADFMRLAALLVIGWVTVPNIINLLLLGLLATALIRLPQVNEHRPLTPGTTAGFWATLLMALALVGAILGAAPEDFTSFAALIVLPPVTVILLTAVLLPRLRPLIFQTLRTALLTVAILGLYGGIVVWLMHGGPEAITTLRQTLDMSGNPNNGASPDGKIVQAQNLLGLAFGLAIPLLLVIILSIASRVRRVPVSAGLIEGFHTWMPSLVCLLMFAYGGLVLWTVQKERAVNYGLERSLHGEGQYLAQLTGQTWPR